MNSKKKHKLFNVIITILVCFLVASCTQTSEEGYKTKTLRFAQQVEDTYQALVELIIKEQSLFDKYLPEDVNVEWSIVNSHNDKRDGLVSGQLDMGVVSLPVFISAYENGLPIVPLANVSPSPFFLFVNKKNPDALLNLKPGDKITSTSSLGNNAHLALKIACRSLYGDANIYDEYMVGMPMADVLASAAVSTDIAASVMGYPFGMAEELAQFMEVALDLTPYANEYSLTVYFITSQKFYDENPKLIDAYYKAANDAVSFILNSPDEAAAILQKYWTAYSIDEIKQLFMDMPPRLEISESGYGKLAQFMYESNLIPNPPKKLSDLSNYDTLPIIE
jgi:ABC-type nitrate/sulfonate/bicarbonate transport system substrate-binding protein